MTNRRSLTLGVVSVGLFVAGCGSQAGEDYRGEPLMTVRGTVVLEGDGAPSDLVPALEFAEGDEPAGDEEQVRTRLRLIDADVTGSFPASFTMNVFEPPPARALITYRAEPGSTETDGAMGLRYAFGSIAAVAKDHPDTLPSLEEAVADSSDSCDANTCDQVHTICTMDHAACFVQHQRCDKRPRCEQDEQGVWTCADQAASCQVTATSGDPDLGGYRRTVAGFSKNYHVFYADRDVPGTSLIAGTVNHGSPISRGYSLLRVVEQTGAEMAAALNCDEAAKRDGWAAYNAQHGTQYASSEDVPLPEREAVTEAWRAIFDRLTVERACGSSDERRFELVPRGVTQPITIEIGRDLQPEDLLH